MSLEVQAAEKLFYEERVFKIVVYTETGLLITALVLGVLWEVCVRNKDSGRSHIWSVNHYRILYLIGQKFVGQNCRNFDLVSKVLSNEKFCPIFQYKSQAKIGQKCRNFGWVSKILSD